MTSKGNGDTNKVKEELTKAQQDFLNLCREIGYGKIEAVIIQNGQPVYASIVKQDYKFGS